MEIYSPYRKSNTSFASNTLKITPVLDKQENEKTINDFRELDDYEMGGSINIKFENVVNEGTVKRKKKNINTSRFFKSFFGWIFGVFKGFFEYEEVM